MKREMEQCRITLEVTGGTTRVFKNAAIKHGLVGSLSDVTGKAKYLIIGENPCFIVTSITDKSWSFLLIPPLLLYFIISRNDLIY